MNVRVKVERVTLDTATNRFVVILKDETKNRWLPIVVGSTEAQAIALQLERITPPRPLTHDLIKNMLDSIAYKVIKVIVNDLRENTYYALIGIKGNGKTFDIDARPSDAIALALRERAPIYVEEEVMRKAAVTDGGSEEPDEFEKIPTEFSKLEELNIELARAVREERYEEAARLRDEIMSLKKKERQ